MADTPERVEEASSAPAPPRVLVPSERERSLGAPVPEARFWKPVKQEVSTQGPGPGKLASFLSAMNPANIDGPKLPLIAIGLTGLIASWESRILDLVQVEIKTEFRLSVTSLFALNALMFPIVLLTRPAIGYLVDRLPRVWFLRIGSLISHGAFILQSLAGSMPQLAGAQAVGSLGGSVRGPADDTLIPDYYPYESRTRAYSFISMMGRVGGFVSLPLTGFMVGAFGWRPALWVLGLLGMAVSVLFFFIKEPVRGYQDRKEMGASEEVAKHEQKPVSWAEAWRTAGSIRTLRRLWIAQLFTGAAAAGFGRITQLYYAQEFGLGPEGRSLILTASAVAATLGLAVAGPIGDKLLSHKPQRIMIAMGLFSILHVIPVLIMVLSRNLVLSVAVELPIDFLQAGILVGQSTLMSVVIPARMRGSGMQIIALFQVLPVLVPVLAIAPIADQFGIRQSMLALVPLAVIGGVLLIFGHFSVSADIRAARAAGMADEEVRRARERKRAKMLVVRDLDVAYEGVDVLFNVDFDLEEGEMAALLGTNGAGKSTLLKAIAGVEHASNGAIFFDGEDTTHAPPQMMAERGVVLVPGGPAAIFPELTVRENLQVATGLYRKDRKFVGDQMRYAMEMFPVLRARMGTRGGNLSGGEQRMLSIAQALMMRPRLLLIDELSLGLAANVLDQLIESLKRIRDGGTTVVVVEQSITVALRAAERAVFMEKGEVRFDGPSAELNNRPELLRSVLLSGVAAAAPGLTYSSKEVRSEGKEVLLEVEDISVNFGGVRALSGVGMHARAGEVVGIVGANGAGKTTLFDVISGFLEPEPGGRIAVGGRNVTRLTPDMRARRGLGRAFQDTRLFPGMTARENVMVALERTNHLRDLVSSAVWAPSACRSLRKQQQRAAFLLDLMDLGGSGEKFLSELSTGLRRAVEVACMMAAEPKVVLLDEPSSGLAQAESVELGPLLLRISAETGCAMVVVEHNLPLITSISDRLVALDLGRVIAEGDPDVVMADPVFMKAYMGQSGQQAGAP